MPTDSESGTEAGQAPELRMRAYYYSFKPTGVLAVDKVLSAVATAGKAYHHTESWSDDDDGPSLVSKIQAAANDAASVHADMLTALKAVVRVADRDTVEFAAARTAIAAAEGRET